MASLILFYLLAFISVAFPQPFSHLEDFHWNNFKVSHGKRYKSIDEELTRKQIFLKNHRLIESHNKLYEEGKKTFKMKMNKFGDLDHVELKTVLNGGLLRLSEDVSEPKGFSVRPQDLPVQVDWREKGAVTPVKDQGRCGSCWAFGALASLESAHFLKTGKLVALSEQELMDCSMGYGQNNGCGGGEISDAFRFIQENGGVDTLDSYPYEEREGVCRFKKDSVGATLSNYTLIKPRSEVDLQAAVALVGPVSASINTGIAMMFYDTGVYYGEDCDSDHLDHAVAVVGYGTCPEGDYWIVRNSHGIDFGEEGYIRMSRNRDNNCGIATSALYPVV